MTEHWCSVVEVANDPGSDALDSVARATLGRDQPLRMRGLADGRRGYLSWHRERVFERGWA